MHLKWLKIILFFVFTVSPLVHAGENSRLRVGGDLGLGIASVKVANADRKEGPGTFGVCFEYSVDSIFSYGAEHLRSLVNDNGPSSGVGITNLYNKIYFLKPRSMVSFTDQTVTSNSIFVRDLVPYVGAAVGISQASLRSLNITQAQDRSLSVGSNVGLKIGLEFNIFSRFTSFSEISINQTIVGTGSIQFIRISSGIQINL